MEQAWRDIGGGMVRCDKTGKVARMCDIRGARSGRTIELTEQQWAKLTQLARLRGMSPEECIASFIESAEPAPPRRTGKLDEAS